jgi:hypothetical protein
MVSEITSARGQKILIFSTIIPLACGVAIILGSYSIFARLATDAPLLT